MREESIRPVATMADQAARVEQDQHFLLDRQDRFVRVACPACDGTSLTVAFEKDGFTYDLCGDCETVLLNPRPEVNLMHEFYETSANYAHWQEHIFPAAEDARRQHLYRPRAERLVEICADHGVRMGAALEIGAGFGTFCEELERLARFDRVIALEPVPSLADTCRRKGLETIHAPVECCDLPARSVNVVASFEVIEHVFSPADFVQAANRMLRPGGLLVLSCPNVKGFDVATLGTLSHTIDHEHVNYFHPTSLTRLLERHGLEVLEVLTPGRLDAELVRKAVLAGALDLAGRPFLQRVLIDEWDRLGDPFQAFLADHQLSGHMWAVARTHA